MMNNPTSNLKHPTSSIQPQTSNLKIAFDAKRAFNNHTGLGNYSRFVILGMLRLFPQHEFYLFTPKVKPEFANLVKEFPNAHVITPQGILGKSFKSLWRSFGIVGLLNKFGVDVYHGLSNELPVNIQSFKGKKVVTIHDLIFLRYPHYYKPIDRRIYTRKFKQACEQADVLVAASEQTAHDIKYYFATQPEKIKIGYQNCDEQFALKLSQEQKQDVKTKYNLPKDFMVCIGTIEPRKRQLDVLRAFAKAQVSSSLVFVGRQTAYAQELHQFIKQNNLTTRVQFIEGAAFQDFPAFYQLAQKAIYASEFEGFGIPILEAMRGGVEVLVAETSSLTEVGGNAVSYFPLGDTQRLARLMEQHQPQTSDNVVAQLAKFDTELLLNQLMQTYLH